MRKKSVNIYYTTSIDTKEKLNLIKDAGYDEFHTGIREEIETMNLAEQIDYAKSLGLTCTMIHCQYNIPNVNDFWNDNEIGEKLFNWYSSQLKSCKGLTKNFVVHLNAGFDSKISEVGLSRVKKLLEICDELDINLCVENLFSTEEIPYLFKNIKNKHLKICFDSGHRNFLTPDFDVMKDYGNHVSVLHLHDNFGKTDEHNICGNGTIDWDDFAKNVAKHKDLVLCAELKEEKPDINYLRKQMEEFNKLDKLIEKYENL